MKASMVALAALLSAACPVCLEADDNGSLGKWVNPLIRSEGKIVALAEATFQPRRGSKAVFDITAQPTPETVAKGLVRVARWLNLNAAADVDPRDTSVCLVLHGDATKAALRHDAYLKHVGVKRNPNLDLLRELKRQGVQLYVCGQALAHHGFAPSEVESELKIATAALSVIISKQQQGYASLPY